MSLEANKAIVRKLVEALNKHDLTVLDELVVSDYVNQTMRMASREAFKKALSVQYGGFPDVHRTIEDIIAEGDKVWVRAKITGTHTGDYLGIAPTGKKFVMSAVPMYRIVDGKITEGWSVWNSLDLFKQIGVIEYTEAGKQLFPESE